MPVLGYWKTRGLGQPIRLLLAYVDEEFEDVLYEMGDGPDFSKEAWLSVKYNLGLPVPNIPYYIDDDMKITQSNAILRYIGRKYDLLGKTEGEKIRVDVMLEQAMDYRNLIIDFVYNPRYEEMKTSFYGNLPDKLQQFSCFLEDRPYFAGENISVCDFPIYELLDQTLIMKADSLDAFPSLKSFHDRFQSIPQVKTYLDDPTKKLPINNKFAKFIGK